MLIKYIKTCFMLLLKSKISTSFYHFPVWFREKNKEFFFFFLSIFAALQSSESIHTYVMFFLYFLIRLTLKKSCRLPWFSMLVFSHIHSYTGRVLELYALRFGLHENVQILLHSVQKEREREKKKYLNGPYFVSIYWSVAVNVHGKWYFIYSFVRSFRWIYFFLFVCCSVGLVGRFTLYIKCVERRASFNLHCIQNVI